MNKFLASLTFILILASCSNAPEMETGEIRTLQLLKKAFESSNKPKRFLDSKTLLNRKRIDEINSPLLFVELPSGQNGTLVPYPGKGVGQTWLAADGATITTDNGILKASRGMGDDLMGSSSSMPFWLNMEDETQSYSRVLIHITGNNKISRRVFKCNIKKIINREVIKIWEVTFKVDRFEENCRSKSHSFRNIYYIDTQGIVRKSFQYHSDTIGYILMERLDR